MWRNLECLNCGKHFRRELTNKQILIRNKGKFCSTACFFEAYTKKPKKNAGICVKCGKPWNRGYIGRRFCSRKCMSRYGGGRYIDSKGYVRVIVAGKDYKEHRIVMQQHLGRPLLRSEEIHHKNGLKHDNRLCNLELLTKEEHGKITASNLRTIWRKFHLYIKLHPEFIDILNEMEEGDDSVLSIPLLVTSPFPLDHESEAGHSETGLTSH